VDLWYSAMGNFEWYNPGQVTTRDGGLVITMDSTATTQTEMMNGGFAFLSIYIYVFIFAFFGRWICFFVFRPFVFVRCYQFRFSLSIYFSVPFFKTDVNSLTNETTKRDPAPLSPQPITMI